MTITAKQKFARQAPRKVRLVANSVRKMKLEAAIRQLGVMDRTASILVLKTIRQAVANAMNNHGFKFEDLELKNILVDGAATYKRYRAASRGRGNSVFKRSSHVTVLLEKTELNPVAIAPATELAKKEKKEAAPVKAVAKTKTPAKKMAASKPKKVSTK
jgi:large subunit ribosomal protein L22